MTFARLRELLVTDDSELSDIMQMIRLDPALTFHVIRMSHSVLFGIRLRNDSLESAVQHVGFAEIQRLVALAGVSETDLEECAERARAHDVLLCATAV